MEYPFTNLQWLFTTHKIHLYEYHFFQVRERFGSAYNSKLIFQYFFIKFDITAYYISAFENCIVKNALYK